MDLSRIISFVTPFTIVAFMGVIAIAIGLMNMGRENNILQFMFGIPLMLGFAGADFLARRLLRHNLLWIWLVEGFFVALLWYQFRYVW